MQSKVLMAEDLTMITIESNVLEPGMMVAVTSNVTEDKTYCIVKSISTDRIVFYKHIDRFTTFTMEATADDVIEYDIRIEIL